MPLERTVVVDSEMIKLIRSVLRFRANQPEISGFRIEDTTSETGEKTKRLIATDTWRLLIIDFDGKTTFSTALEELPEGTYRIIDVAKLGKTTSKVRIFEVMHTTFPNYRKMLPEVNGGKFRSMDIGLYRDLGIADPDHPGHVRLQVQGSFNADLALLPSGFQDYKVRVHKRLVPKKGIGDLYTFHHNMYQIYYLVVGLELAR